MIHPSALVSPAARLGKDVHVGPFTVIHDNVVLGDRCRVEGFCELGVGNHLSSGEPLIIGADAHIRSHSIFYEASSFAEGLVTGHRVTVRERTRAGKNLQIGTLGDIQGHCSIGDYVRFHSNVHIGQKSTIGNCVWIFPYVVLTNDPHPPSNHLVGVTVEDYAVIATMSVILPGVRIARGVLVGAHALVNRDTEPDQVYLGNPARAVCATSSVRLQDGSGQPAYPWTHHFHRGYPEELVRTWLEARAGQSSSSTGPAPTAP